MVKSIKRIAWFVAGLGSLLDVSGEYDEIKASLEDESDMKNIRNDFEKVGGDISGAIKKYGQMSHQGPSKHEMVKAEQIDNKSQLYLDFDSKIAEY